MGTASPAELAFFASAVAGVVLGGAATLQTIQKRRALEAAGINGLRRAYARMRIRQELVRLVVQALFLAAAALAVVTPATPGHERSGRVDAIIVALILAEWAAVANSLLDQYRRRELLEEIEKREESTT